MVSRRILGTTVVGGMVFASFIAIFLIPVSFYAMEKLTGQKALEPTEPAKSDEHADIVSE
jgi:hydrophobic/amphiphilic exporter-1 (mainly G- bacteria), HAE1 family